MNSDNEKLEKNLNDLLNEMTFANIAKNSVVHLRPSTHRLCFLAIFFVICFVLLFYTDYFCVGVKNILNLLLPVLATLLTMSFAGFAIFQIMVSPEAMRIFLENNSGNKSLFSDVNSEYFALFLMELVLLVIGIVLIIIFNLFPLGWRIPILSNNFNIILASGGISFYFTMFLHAVIEIKSFAYNLYSCFKLVALNNYLWKNKQ